MNIAKERLLGYMGNKIFQRVEIIRSGNEVQILYNESNHISMKKYDLSIMPIAERIFLEQIFALIMQLNDTKR